MNYSNHYDMLINRAKNRILGGYYETHHVIPRCMGGDDSEENLVRLTAEEHYIAHLLLVKIYPDHKGLVWAAIMMTGHGSSDGRVNNKLYSWLRERHSKNAKSRTGNKNGSYGTMWISNLERECSKKIDREGEIPDGWVKGRNVWKKKLKKGHDKKYSDEVARTVLDEWERGVPVENILCVYGFPSEQSIRNLLNKRFPNRKRFRPKQRV